VRWVTDVPPADRGAESADIACGAAQNICRDGNSSCVNPIALIHSRAYSCSGVTRTTFARTSPGSPRLASGADLATTVSEYASDRSHLQTDTVLPCCVMPHDSQWPVVMLHSQISYQPVANGSRIPVCNAPGNCPSTDADQRQEKKEHTKKSDQHRTQGLCAPLDPSSSPGTVLNDQFTRLECLLAKSQRIARNKSVRVTDTFASTLPSRTQRWHAGQSGVEFLFRTSNCGRHQDRERKPSTCTTVLPDDPTTRHRSNASSAAEFKVASAIRLHALELIALGRELTNPNRRRRRLSDRVNQFKVSSNSCSTSGRARPGSPELSGSSRRQQQ